MDSLFNTSILNCLDRIEQISRDAGDAIMEVYKNTIDVSYKPDHSPLTEADLNANRIIVNALKYFYPEVPILTEEAVGDFKGINKKGFYWLVDPLDGTKEFIQRNGEFTVNIALIQNGEPILGVVFAPEKKLMYRGAKGYGAFKQEGDAQSQAIKVNSRQEGDVWRVVGSRSHDNDTFKSWVLNLGESEIILMGSSLKICLVAEGSAHIYPRLGPTSFWDIAAAHIILKEAGGEIIDFKGQELKYNNVKQPLNPDFIVSSDKTDYNNKPLEH
jgi:3'(2'), 5'-bisphosphate nucleotidase